MTGKTFASPGGRPGGALWCCSLCTGWLSLPGSREYQPTDETRPIEWCSGVDPAEFRGRRRLTIPVGWLCQPVRKQDVSIVCSSFVLLLVVPLGLAFNAVSLAGRLFVFGALAAAMDVSMNAQGVEVEKAIGRPTMSRFHGMFSLGGMIGAALEGAVAARRAPVPLHFATVHGSERSCGRPGRSFL